MIETTEVFESYWYLAAERLQMYLRRARGEHAPWTCDPILEKHRFTNAYRAADRVSQYLIAEVQYGEGRSRATRETFFRTMLFKLFNRIETWEALEEANGRLGWEGVNLENLNSTLDAMALKGIPVYSGAYIMASPAMGGRRKHTNHLRLVKRMMDEDVPEQVREGATMKQVYERLVSYPGIGRFLGFQIATDLNYSTMTDFDEGDFVVAGPGALDGISKCFSSTGGLTAEEIIEWTQKRQREEFEARGLIFEGLFGRELKLVDCQNIYCEISKYARVRHPGISGVAGRKRIKQTYTASRRALPRPWFPPKWELKVPDELPAQSAATAQMVLM